jgi:hypothetical protein
VQVSHDVLGDEPCAILMAGARGDDWKVRYPLSAFEPSRRGRPSYWNQLPWA